MKKKYTKRQIEESIRYWKNQLRNKNYVTKNIFESWPDGFSQDWQDDFDMYSKSKIKNTIASERQLIKMLEGLDDNGINSFFYFLSRVIDSELLQKEIERTRNIITKDIERISGESPANYKKRNKQFKDTRNQLLKVYKFLNYVIENSISTTGYDNFGIGSKEYDQDPEVYESEV